MKVVIDTNIWISFLIGRLLSGLEDYLIDGAIEVITSEEQLSEIKTVLQRPKFNPFFSERDIIECLVLLCKTTITVETKHEITDCRDIKDNFILEMAVNGKVDYIITGDKDLLIMSPYKGINIITYKEFEDTIQRIKRG
ncbi:MAG: putative toxin-antitoxin system toxin component, PIN family [Thermodesulfovibrionales bacterium]|nr:putative toxin-antitoxin system toxin component, PIN family [Thermodesulfovibrionales bacterium]